MKTVESYCRKAVVDELISFLVWFYVPALAQVSARSALADDSDPGFRARPKSRAC